jgi:hypothetical protein
MRFNTDNDVYFLINFYNFTENYNSITSDISIQYQKCTLMPFEFKENHVYNRQRTRKRRTGDIENTRGVPTCAQLYQIK